MLRLLHLLILCLLIIPLKGQNHWEKLDQTDGLIGNEVHHFIAENQNKWWIVTDFGIALHQNGIVSNYPIPGLTNGVVNALEIAQGKLWIASSNGLYSFDGASFQNYGSTAGFKSLSISAIDADSQDNLWIGTDSAVSMFNGQAFVRHDSVQAKHLLVDGNDHVHAYRFDMILNFPNFNQVFDNNQWVDYGNLISQIYDGKDFISDNGKIYLSRSQDSNAVKGIWEIDYPNAPQFLPLEYNSQFGNTNYTSLVKENNNFYAADRFRLFNTADSILDLTHIRALGGPEINRLAMSDDKLFLCTKVGLVYIDKASIRNVKLDSLDVNEVKSKVLEFGPPFSNTLGSRAAGFGFPKNALTYSAFVADFMFVGRDSATHGFKSTPIPYLFEWNAGPVNSAYGLNKSYMVKIKKQEVIDHISNYNQPGYQMPASIRNWPAVGDSSLGIPTDLAPFADVNQNACYDPANGDYPIMKGDEAIYWIRHNADSNLLLEYHYMLYAYNNPQYQELNQAQFLECRIVNRGADFYDSAKVGFYFDGDLGNPADDYVGCDSANNIAYFYNGDNFDEGVSGQTGYGANSPAVGIKFLSDSMTNMVYFNIGSGQNGDPVTSIQRWNYLNSRWKNGSPVLYGGNGLNSLAVTNQPTTHMYTGDPYNNTGWTERDPGPGENSNSPGDRRLLAAMDHFQFRPGESKVVEMVMAYGRKGSVNTHWENVPEMLRVLNSIEDFWDTLSVQSGVYGQNYDCPDPVGLADRKLDEAKFSVYPNPASSQLILEAEVPMERVQFFSLSGGLVKDLQLNTSRANLDVSEMNNGLYLIRIFSEQKGWISKKILIEK